jgi:hypothetical protein
MIQHDCHEQRYGKTSPLSETGGSRPVSALLVHRYTAAYTAFYIMFRILATGHPNLMCHYHHPNVSHNHPNKNVAFKVRVLYRTQIHMHKVMSICSAGHHIKRSKMHT